mgnify:CR=1 FL=1
MRLTEDASSMVHKLYHLYVHVLHKMQASHINGSHLTLDTCPLIVYNLLRMQNHLSEEVKVFFKTWTN